MQVTNVQFRQFKGNDKLLGFASVELDGQIVITGLRVIAGQHGIFVAFPSKQDNKTKEWHEIVFPTTKEAREMIQDAVKKEVGVDDTTRAAGPKNAPTPVPDDDDFF